MLPKGKDDGRKGLLQSIISLNDNPDFAVVMEYLDEAGYYCAAKSCTQDDDTFAKKCAGGFITIHEFKNLVEGAGEELDKIKKRNR